MKFVRDSLWNNLVKYVLFVLSSCIEVSTRSLGMINILLDESRRVDMIIVQDNLSRREIESIMSDWNNISYRDYCEWMNILSCWYISNERQTYRWMIDGTLEETSRNQIIVIYGLFVSSNLITESTRSILSRNNRLKPVKKSG